MLLFAKKIIERPICRFIRFPDQIAEMFVAGIHLQGVRVCGNSAGPAWPDRCLAAMTESGPDVVLPFAQGDLLLDIGESQWLDFRRGHQPSQLIVLNVLIGDFPLAIQPLAGMAGYAHMA